MRTVTRDREPRRVSAPLEHPENTVVAARRNARRASAARVGAAPGRLVVFRLSGECFAVEVECVERVLAYAPGRRVPDAAPWIIGAISYEARLVPAIDLGRRLGLAPAAGARKARTLIIRDGDERLGAVVDEVLTVHPAADAELEPAPAVVRGIPGSYVRALTRIDGQVVLVLDLARLLSAVERMMLRATSMRADA